MQITKQMSGENYLTTRICCFCQEEYFSKKESESIFCSDYCKNRAMDAIEVNQQK